MAGYGLLGAVLAMTAACGPHEPPSAQIAAGNCLRNPGPGDPQGPPHIQAPGVTYKDAVPSYCDDTRAFAKIVKVTPEASGCAPDTDGTFFSYGAGTACTLNLEPPHEGAPGNGGGLLQIGDCLQVDLNDDGRHLNLWSYQETGCGTDARPGDVLVQITKAVARVSACGKGLLPFAKQAPGVPRADVADDTPDDDWPSVYGPVFCVQRLAAT